MYVIVGLPGGAPICDIAGTPTTILRRHVTELTLEGKVFLHLLSTVIRTVHVRVCPCVKIYLGVDKNLFGTP